MFVCVLSKSGTPLMPTNRFGRVRRLLKNGEAKIICYHPFTIQLLYDSTEFIQPLTAGVKVGSKHCAVSVSSEKKEVYAVQVNFRTDISELMSTRRESRRTRRNRKTRYRQPRFNNRTKPEGWLAPSVQHKVDAALKTLETVRRYMPVSEYVAEVAPFDIQKLKDPDISGVEYQQGDQLGYANVREYVLYRDGHKCRVCNKKNVTLRIHHIESRKTGGNAPNNLITLCEDCHRNHHNNTKKSTLKRGKPYKDATQTAIISKRVVDWLVSNNLRYSTTFGYITKYNRNELGITKSYVNDAFVISGNSSAERLNTCEVVKCIRRNDRSLHKFNTVKGGERKRIRLPKEVFGFRSWDKVRIGDKVGYVSSRRSNGYFDIKDIENKVIHNGKHYRHLRLIERGTTRIKGNQ